MFSVEWPQCGTLRVCTFEGFSDALAYAKTCPLSRVTNSRGDTVAFDGFDYKVDPLDATTRMLHLALADAEKYNQN